MLTSSKTRSDNGLFDQLSTEYWMKITKYQTVLVSKISKSNRKMVYIEVR